MKKVDGVPFIQKNPKVFQKLLDSLTKVSYGLYTQIDSDVSDDSTFFGVDLEE